MMYASSSDSKLSDSAGDTNNVDSTSSSYKNSKFVFPPAPKLYPSDTNSSCCHSSDSSCYEARLQKTKKKTRRRSAKDLPPIGIFWDIENCQVPRNKSASSIVQRIRDLFYSEYKEAEFVVVCDVRKESPQVVEDLNDAQVNLFHITSTSKNAADEKLRQSLRRFSDNHEAPAAVALISGDVNFASDLCDLRYRKKLRVILIHNANVADALILCANETYEYSCVTENLPLITPKTHTNQRTDLFITDLPQKFEISRLKARLQHLSDNCGGKVVSVDRRSGTAVLKFATYDSAVRAQRRIHGEDVFGNKIKVASLAPTPKGSPFKTYTGRKMKNSYLSYQYSSYSVPPTQDNGGDAHFLQYGNSWRCGRDQEKVNVSLPTFTPVNANMFRPIKGSGYMDISLEQTFTSRHTSFSERRCHTPHNVAGGFLLQGNRALTSGSFSDSNEDFRLYSNLEPQPEANSAPIELTISNLDPSVDIKDLRKILVNVLKQYVMILNLAMHVQADGSRLAVVKVRSQQEAKMAISQLHRQKLGNRRITISYAQSNSPDPEHLRAVVVALLQEVPRNRMPLFKFLDLLEARFHSNISASEVNKLKDVCKITDEEGGRMINLLSDVRLSPPSNMSNVLTLFCPIHCPHGLENRGWAESDYVQLPNVNISLLEFSKQVHNLLAAHTGSIPLFSFPVCYQFHFGQKLPESEAGVPLEHLIACVNDVVLTYGDPNKTIKIVKRDVCDPKVLSDEHLLYWVSPGITEKIRTLCRELVELCKTMDKCQLSMNRFIPAYHHHFGKQCRVADYGYTRLIDLFEDAASHVIQILGAGPKRMLTLTHALQVHRFTIDLTRVVKSQMSKQLTLGEFPVAYERVMHKSFDPVEYGLCSLEDLVEEVAESTVVITKDKGVTTIAISKKVQTDEEISCTREFASRVIILLQHSPHCTMLYNNFVPAYHRHFGHQCKVSEYGFTKLIELFEAIPDIIKVEYHAGEERKVRLTLPYSLQVLGIKIQNLIMQSRSSAIPLESLSGIYMREYGYTLKPEEYECANIQELLQKLDQFVQVVHGSAGPLLVLANMDIYALGIKVWTVLMAPPHSLTLQNFTQLYRVRYQTSLSCAKLEQLKHVVNHAANENGEACVSLQALYVLAAELYQLLHDNLGQLPYSSLYNAYLNKYNKPLRLADYNVKSLDDLLKRLSFLLVVKRGSLQTLVVFLNKELAVYGVAIPGIISHEALNEKLDWPLLPTHSVFGNWIKDIPPPKPNTSSPAQGAWRSSIWSTPHKSEFSSYENLSILLPTVQTPKIFKNADGLISPTRSLLSAYGSNFSMAPPDPSLLPRPDKLLAKGTSCDDLSDSGVMSNSRFDITSDNQMDITERRHTIGDAQRFMKNFKTLNK